MSGVRTLEATAVKDGKWWTITIPDVYQATVARKAGEIQEYTESLAAKVLGVPASELDVRLSVQGRKK